MPTKITILASSVGEKRACLIKLRLNSTPEFIGKTITFTKWPEDWKPRASIFSVVKNDEEILKTLFFLKDRFVMYSWPKALGNHV